MGYSYSAASVRRRMLIVVWGLAIGMPLAGMFCAKDFFIDYGLETRGVVAEGKIIHSTIGQSRTRTNSLKRRGTSYTQVNHVVEYADAAGSKHTTISIEQSAYNPDASSIKHLPIGTPIKVVYDSQHPEIAKPVDQFNSFPNGILMGLGILVAAIDMIALYLWLTGRKSQLVIR